MISQDLLWKGIVKDLFEDFLLLFFAPYADTFDLSKGFEFLEQELAQIAPDSDSSRRVADLLVKVFLKNGSERWFLIHIEIQGYVDEHFPKRMFIYFYRILDRFDKPVTSLAILTDDKEDFHPTSFELEFMGTKTIHSFNCVKLAKMKAEDFSDRRNIFTLVLETAWLGLAKNRKSDEATFNHAMRLKRNLLEGGFPKNKIRKVLEFLEYNLTFGKPELREKLTQEIHSTKEAMGISEVIAEHFRQEGIQEGEKLGVEKGEKLGIEKGEKLGIEKGEKLGIEKGIHLSVRTMLQNGIEPAFIAKALSLDLFLVLEIEDALKLEKKQSEKGHDSSAN